MIPTAVDRVWEGRRSVGNRRVVPDEGRVGQIG